jgi:hypothetical protein
MAKPTNEVEIEAQRAWLTKVRLAKMTMAKLRAVRKEFAEIDGNIELTDLDNAIDDLQNQIDCDEADAIHPDNNL